MQRTASFSGAAGTLSWWCTFLAAGFPALVAVQLALSLYAANAEELDGGRSALARFLVLCLGGWVVLVVALRWGRALGRILWLIGSAYAVFFLVREVAFPLPIGELDGEEPLWSPSAGYLAAEIGTFIGALALLALVRFQVMVRAVAAVAVVFLVSNVITLAGKLDALGPVDQGSPALSIPAPATEASSRPDVYHVLFDSYQTVEHLYLRREKGPAPFDDFICYRHNISNYTRTWLSIPSLFTGTFCPADENIRDWSRAFERDGLVKVLKEHGYQVRVFGPNAHWWKSELVDYRRTTPQIAQEHRRQHEADELFLPLVALRLLPSFAGPALFTSMTSAADLPPASEKAYWCTLKFREMVAGIRHTRPGGNYTFIHMLLPHGPCVLDADGNYVGKQGTRHAADQFLEKLVAELIDELKRLGRYDSSLIVIHADTGCIYDVDLEKQSLYRGAMLQPAAHTMTDADWVDGARFQLDVVKARVNAALLIKPPGRKGSEMSDSPSQLVDLGPTILGAVGIPIPPGDFREGCDLLNSPPGPDRVRRCFIVGNPRGGSYVPRFQEYLVRHNDFQKGAVISFNRNDQ